MEMPETNAYPLIDPEQISMLVEAGADESFDLFNEILALFEEESYLKLAQLQQSVRDGNYDELGRAAHALAGSSANVGGREVWLRARDIENLCKAGRGDEAARHVPDLVSLFDETIGQLKGFASAIQNG